MFSFIYKINSKEKPLSDLKIKNDTAAMELAKLTESLQAFTAMTTTAPNEISYSTEDYTTTTTMATTTTDAITDAVISTTVAAISKVRCYNITVKCSKPWRVTKNYPSTTTVAATTTLLLLNLTTTMIPTTITTTTTEQPTTTMATTTTWTPSPTTTEPPTTTTPMTTTTTMTTEFTTMPTTTTTFLPSTTTDATYDYEDSTFSSTEEDEQFSSSPSSVLSSTTTESPGNDSQFLYYDYFAGFDIDEPSSRNKRDLETMDYLDLDDYLEVSKENDVYKTSQNSLKNKLKSKDFKIVNKETESKAKKVKRQQADSKGPDPLALQLLRTSKYGRRDRYTTTTTLQLNPITTTLKSTLPTLPTPTTVDDSTDNPFTTSNHFSSSLPTTEIDTETTTSSKGLLWERNELLAKVAEFFTTSTLRTTDDDTTTFTPTPPPTTTPPPTSPTTTISSNKQEEDELIENANEDDDDDDGLIVSTPFYIANQDIGPTSFYEWNEIDDGNFETCFITVCDNDFTTMPPTTDMDAGTTTATITTTELTIYQQYLKNLTEIKKTFKEIEHNLTTMCWETSLGQELSKVIVFDGVS